MVNRMRKIKKYSADDVPQWAPDWVKEHKEFKSIDKLSNLPKEIPIDNYREDLSKEDASDLELYVSQGLSNEELKLRSLMISYGYKAQEKLYNAGSNTMNFYHSNEYRFLEKITNKFLNQLVHTADIFKKFKLNEDITETLNAKITTKTGEEKEVTKTINIPIGTSLIKVCKIIEKIFETYAPGDAKIIKLDPTGSEEFAMYSKRNTKEYSFSLVFSTNPEDILAMSSRGMFTSCQDLFKDTGYNKKAIYAAISRYTGIIYITNNQDYEGRGEQIIARAMVFYVIDEDGVPTIGLSAIYNSSGNKIKIRDLFLNSLKEESPLSVISLLVSNDESFTFPNEGMATTPYFDPGNIEVEEVKTPELSEEDQYIENISNKRIYINDIITKIKNAITNNFLNYLLKNKAFENICKIFDDKDFYNILFNRYESYTNRYSYYYNPEDKDSREEVMKNFEDNIKYFKTQNIFNYTYFIHRLLFTSQNDLSVMNNIEDRITRMIYDCFSIQIGDDHYLIKNFLTNSKIVDSINFDIDRYRKVYHKILKKAINGLHQKGMLQDVNI